MILSSHLFLILLLPLLVHGAPTNLDNVNRYILPNIELPYHFKLSDISHSDPRPFGGVIPRLILALEPPTSADKPVDIREEDWDNAVYLFPPGSRYRIPSGPEYEIHGSKTIQTSIIVKTPHGPVVFIPKVPKANTHIRQSLDPIISLSQLNSDARIIFSADQQAVEDFCKRIFYNTPIPLPHRRKKWEPYLKRCSFWNLQHVGRGTEASEFIHVPVYIQ